MEIATLNWTTPAAATPRPVALPTALDPAHIGRRFLGGLMTLFGAGLLIALILRLELLFPEGRWLGADTCGRLISLHALLMVYFVAIPGLPALLTSFLLPTALGRPGLAFPRLHRLAWHLYAAGGALLLLSALWGGVKVSWTFTLAHSTAYAQGPVGLTVAAVLLVALSTLLNALNAVASIHIFRAAGRGSAALPVSAWALYAASLILLIATPVLAATLLLIMVERVFEVGWFAPAQGGNPDFLRQLFWFYATPAMYALFLPALGVVADVAEEQSGRPLRGRRHVVLALLAMIPLSFLLWGRHFMAAPDALAFSLTASLLNHLVVVPVGVLLVLVAASLAGHRGDAGPARLYAWGFIAYTALGAASGLALASGALSKLLHNTQFDVAHLHLLVGGGVLSAVLAGLYHHLPRLTQRQVPAAAGCAAACVLLAGVALTFLPLLALGLRGLPRRLHAYPAEYQVGHVLATAGATILLTGLVLAGLNLLRARRVQTVL